MHLFDLSGKTALITGGSSGIGLAIAMAFVDHGAKVMLAGDQPEALAEAEAGLNARQQGSACSRVVDLAERTAAEALIGDAIGTLGQLDILVSNAGMEGHVGPIGAVDDELYRKTFQVNLDAGVWLSSRAAPHMKSLGGGSIILMSSLSALRGNGAIGVYSLTKAALIQLARTLAVEWGPSNVRANAIVPGLIETPFAKGLMANSDFMKRRMQATPLRRVGQPSEIAATAVYLASPGGAFVTGQAIVVDGGTIISDGS
ncbi:MAG: short-chain dehydrogenase [Hoeflea sp.]|uniref:SDR family NAD(P)-dependent oxidoreductase n=1 Tax=Hoeflea sp. TaxID=1940281 RepID=UPI000C0F5B1B|nr:glucose 1-dehydrogenase [Hoeflea sp.]PHR25433.1 MAG: short-chain dehydrogenase [Hoeflea sp.]